MRFLLGLAILVIVVFALRSLYSRFLAANRPLRNRQENFSRRDEKEAIIRCQHCGVYFPASEAVSDAAGAVFCSDAHRRHSSVR